jgi:hypothetical protein
MAHESKTDFARRHLHLPNSEIRRLARLRGFEISVTTIGEARKNPMLRPQRRALYRYTDVMISLLLEGHAREDRKTMMRKALDLFPEVRREVFSEPRPTTNAGVTTCVRGLAAATTGDGRQPGRRQPGSRPSFRPCSPTGRRVH